MYSISSSVRVSSEMSEVGRGWRGGRCCLLTTSVGIQGEQSKKISAESGGGGKERGREREGEGGRGREREGERTEREREREERVREGERREFKEKKNREENTQI